MNIAASANLLANQNCEIGVMIATTKLLRREKLLRRFVAMLRRFQRGRVTSR